MTQKFETKFALNQRVKISSYPVRTGVVMAITVFQDGRVPRYEVKFDKDGDTVVFDTVVFFEQYLKDHPVDYTTVVQYEIHGVNFEIRKHIDIYGESYSIHGLDTTDEWIFSEDVIKILADRLHEALK